MNLIRTYLHMYLAIFQILLQKNNTIQIIHQSICTEI